MKKPNVVLVFADDLGYGDLSCFNQNSRIHTYNIDRLAEESMRCVDAHASSALCTPSRYGLMTGRYNWRSKLKHSVISGDKKHLIEDGRLTLGLMFKSAGYNTACIGKWHLGLDWTLKEGADRKLTEVDVFNFGKHVDIDYAGNVENGPPAFGFDYSFVTPGSLDIPPYVFVENGRVSAMPDRCTGIDDFMQVIRSGGQEAEEVRLTKWPRGETGADYDMMQVVPETADRILQVIDEYSSRKEPFFVYYPIHAPHTPCLPTPEFAGKSGIGPYGDMVLMIDDIVGRIIEKLQEKGVYDNTVFIFTSDNGSCQNFPEEGHSSNYMYRGMKSDIWDGGHRIPFIVRYPELIEKGTKCRQTVCLTDIMATFAELLGIELKDNEGEDSVSNLSLWKGDDSPVRNATVHSSGKGNFAIRKGKWKLIMCAGSGGWSPDPVPEKGQKLPPVQLYDMENDTGEKNNVWNLYPGVVEELTEELTEYVFSGRSTPGVKQKNTGPERWEQINWL